MTNRRLYAYGLQAGLTWTEMQTLTPGFIMDMYMNRYEYDVKLAYPKAAKKVFGA